MTHAPTRREFIRTTAAAGLASSVLAAAEPTSQPVAAYRSPTQGAKPIWANLLHLSYNMWLDWAPPGDKRYSLYKPYLRFDRKLWNDLLGRMKSAGMNMVVIDLGDGVKYKSHPEIAVENAWSTAELRSELARVRDMGLEPIPKLNFSTTHDTWLGLYQRMVSTPKYYEVCGELIAEVCELFDKPRFFHLGMDEETQPHQRDHLHVTVRQHDLWWHDLLWLVEQTEKAGPRAWIWSDYVWEHSELFFQRMPKSVLQSNWYYGIDFRPTNKAAKAYVDLAEHGYDQVPTGSNWSSPKNFGMTVEYCRKNIPADRLFGFFQTIWNPTIEECRERHEQAIDQVAAVIKASTTQRG
jgi:hypothetical protein